MIYKKKGIEDIKKNISEYELLRDETTDIEKKEEIDQKIEQAREILFKSLKCFGKSKKFSDKYNKAVSRRVKLIKDKIATQSIELYNHFNTFLHTGTLCYYKSDTEIFWQIDEKNQ